MTKEVIGDCELYLGDSLETLKSLESGIAQTCVTSPPYYKLRDYGEEGQIGLEETVEEYIEKLVFIFREVKRVLKDDGTLWMNLGDSYANNSREQPPTNTRNRLGHTAKKIPTGYKRKDLMGIPWRVAFALQNDG